MIVKKSTSWKTRCDICQDRIPKGEKYEQCGDTKYCYNGNCISRYQKLNGDSDDEE